MQIKKTSYIILALALLFSSLVPIAYKIGSNSNPLELAFYISALGLMGSTVIMIVKGTQRHLIEHIKNKRSILPFVVVGASFAIQTVIFSFTTHYISASLLAVLYRSWPLILILLTPLMLRERITKYGLLAVALGFLGITIVFWGGSPVSLPQVAIPFAALVLFAALLDAIIGIFQRRYKYELTSTLFLYNLFLFATVSIFVLYFGAPLMQSLNMQSIYAILFLGIAQNVLLTLLFTAAFRSVNLSIIANSAMSVPFITVVISYIVLNEAIEPAYLIIAFSVLAGLLIQKFAPKAPNYISKLKPRAKTPTLFDVTAAFVNTRNEIVYNEIKGTGRALAFYKKMNDPDLLGVYTTLITDFQKRDNECVITTNKHIGGVVNKDELEFIQEIMGYSNDDLLILGIGNPEKIELAFAELHKKINIDGYTSAIPPKVIS